MKETLLFVLGMVLYYLVASAKFRAFLMRSVKLSSPRKPIKPQPTVSMKTQSILRDKHQVEVDEDEVNKWLRENPDLQGVNK